MLLWRLIISNASSAFDLCNAMLALPLPLASRLEVQAIYDMTIAPNGRRECKDCLLLDGLVEVWPFDKLDGRAYLQRRS